MVSRSTISVSAEIKKQLQEEVFPVVGVGFNDTWDTAFLKVIKFIKEHEHCRGGKKE